MVTEAPLNALAVSSVAVRLMGRRAAAFAPALPPWMRASAGVGAVVVVDVNTLLPPTVDW